MTDAGSYHSTLQAPVSTTLRSLDGILSSGVHKPKNRIYQSPSFAGASLTSPHSVHIPQLTLLTDKCVSQQSRILSCPVPVERELTNRESSSWHFSQMVFISCLAEKGTRFYPIQKVTLQRRKGLFEHLRVHTLSSINPSLLVSQCSRPALNNPKKSGCMVLWLYLGSTPKVQ